MRIDAHDGSVSFTTGSIRHDTDRPRFLASPLAHGAQERVTNAKENWRHVRINPEPDVAATLVFHDDRLHQIYILMAIPADETGGWTMANELERKAKHDAWLCSTFGQPPYQYAWGRIDSEFDSKGCVSEIIVSYAS